MYANEEIRKSARISHVPLWRIAKEMGISEPTMTRKLRVELSEQEKNKMLQIIHKLAQEKEVGFNE